MPAIGRSVTAAAGASSSRQESLDSGREVASQGPQAQEQPGWKLPALALLLLLADPPPEPPAPTPASRTLPTSTHRPADYEERSVNAPTSAVAKLVSLQERSPDKNTQALGALGRASAHPRGSLQHPIELGSCPPSRPGRPSPSCRPARCPVPGTPFAFSIN